MAWEALGEYDNFYRSMRAANRIVPEETVVRRLLIQATLETGRFVEAYDLSEDGLQRWPDDQFTQTNHGIVLLLNGELEVAQSHADRVLERYPDDLEAAFILALVVKTRAGELPIPNSLSELEGRDDR